MQRNLTQEAFNLFVRAHGFGVFNDFFLEELGKKFIEKQAYNYSLDIARKTKDSFIRARMYSRLAKLLRQPNLLEEAEKAADEIDEASFPDNKIEALAHILSAAKELELNRDYFSQKLLDALQICHEQCSNWHLAVTYNRFLQYYLSLDSSLQKEILINLRNRLCHPKNSENLFEFFKVYLRYLVAHIGSSAKRDNLKRH